MEILESISRIKERVAELRSRGKSIGFVPTMGALHQGHVSLVKNARSENDVVVASIFVNPVQFNDPADFERYPRDLRTDSALLEGAGCDILFHPAVDDMYPEPDTTEYDFGQLDKVMEGAYRPGHFRGVAVVVRKLFEIIQPHRVYFGMKDFQQMLIVNKLVKDYHIPVEIVPCSTVREPDGLAMSSRNALLPKNERRAAATIYKVLRMVKMQAGFIAIEELKALVAEEIGREKLLKLEYFEIADLKSLVPLKGWTASKEVIACIAVYAGNVRLIDNVILFS